MKKGIAKGLMGAAVISGLIFWSYTRDVASSDKDAAAQSPRVVTVGQVTRIQNGPTVSLNAITRSATHSRVAFAIGGRIQKRKVEVGDRIKRGQIIARIDPVSFQHAVEAGKANFAEIGARLEQARRDSDRMTALAKEGAIASAEEESVHASQKALFAAWERAEVQVKEAKRQLKESVLRAPFNGVVTAVLAEPGEMVEAGTPVIVLEGSAEVEVEVEVPESLVANVKEGDTLTINLPMIGVEALKGTVTQIGKGALGPGGLFPVVVTLPKTEGVRSGLTAEVRFPTGTYSGIGVPVQAVINPSGQAASVLKVEKNTVKRVAVSTYKLIEQMVEIDGNLKEGDRVVTAGHQQLIDGETVEVLQ